MDANSLLELQVACVRARAAHHAVSHRLDDAMDKAVASAGLTYETMTDEQADTIDSLPEITLLAKDEARLAAVCRGYEDRLLALAVNLCPASARSDIERGARMVAWREKILSWSLRLDAATVPPQVLASIA